jgi:arabinogalactan oligomer/maltooligosaccharide transport system substrate-binding protein
MSKAMTLCLFFVALATVLLTGCGLFGSESDGTSAPPTATSAPVAVDASPESAATADGTPASTPTASGPITLVLWTSEDYAPNSETAGGTLLLDQLNTFQQRYDVNVDVILKKRSGSGGLLDFLTTASAAAPSVLPDLITLSHSDLYRAAQAGLLQPLDDLLSPNVLDDQFNFARTLTRVDDMTMGVLYQADLQHLVYDTTQVTAPPATWQEVYSATVPFVFSPAAPGEGVNNVILIQYLSLGGSLTDADGRPALNIERLTEALTFFNEARQAGTIPRSVLELSDATTAWATFRIGEAGMVEVPASLFLAERAGLGNVGFGPVPLSIPDVMTVGQGWGLAIVTKDPGRQQLAASLIEHLLLAENSGAWTRAAGRLPTRNAALAAWGEDDPYVSFIRNLLAHAAPSPNPDVAAATGGPLVQALVDVLSGAKPPAEAAQAAAEAVAASR